MTGRGLEAVLLDRVPAIEALIASTPELVAEGLDPVEAAKRIANQADPKVLWDAAIVGLAEAARKPASPAVDRN
jgi:hypothetical protein